MVGQVCSKRGDSDDTFPDSLQGFGYEFKESKMRKIGSEEGFEFVVREGDQSYNQRHYEALGEVMTGEVYKLLETECNLKPLPVPIDAKDSEPSTIIFASKDAQTNPEKLLILIHGSGVVRAGQWARRLIINDSLDSGTQIPFIKEAMEAGYDVLVMNTNDNYRGSRRESGKIRGSESPECHALYVWEHYINPAKAKHIAIVAHSYGGCVTTALFKNKREEFMKRVFCVAMTDSVHFLSNPAAYKKLIKVSRNWVCSKHPLDTPVSTFHGDIKRVSAGVTIHEQTSWASISSVFRFMRQKLALVKGKEEDEMEEAVINSDEDMNPEGDMDADGGTCEDGDKGDVSVTAKKDGYGGHAMSDDDDDEGTDTKMEMTS